MTMLTRKEGWKEVLEIPPTESEEGAEALTVAEVAPKKKKKKESTVTKDVNVQPAKEESADGLRGDLALVIFVSCMVDLISTGGISPSNTGWMDEYVKMITDAPDIEEQFPNSKPAAEPTPKADDDKSEEGPVRRSSRKRSKKATAKAIERAADAEDVSRTSPKAGKKSSSWVRPNVTDEVAYLTKLLIEAHTSCLQDCFQQHLVDTNSASALKNMEAEMRRLVVNDDDSYRDSLSYRRNDSKELVNSIPFYPFMHRTLETLGRTASSSSFVSTTGTKSRILAIGGAIALGDFANQFERVQHNAEEIVVMDAKLLSLAVCQLAETFTGFAKHFLATKKDSNNGGSSNKEALSENCGENAFAEVLKKYRLNEPLVIQRVTRITDLDPRAVDAAVTYGGVFPRQGDATSGGDDSGDLWMRTDPSIHAEVIACFIRAQLGSSSSEDVNLSAIESFNKSLLSILHMCYEFSSGKQNRKSDTKQASSKKKKRKVSAASSSVGQNDADVKTVTRCVLAADTLNFMRKCLASNPEWKDSSALTKGMEFLCIRALFGRDFSTELIKEFVNLGYLLQDKLIYPRLSQTINDTSSSIPESSKVIFEPTERRLWCSHVKMAIVIARGQVVYKPHSKGSLLQESEVRLEVFQHIAEAEQERHSDETHRSRNRQMEHHWPLFLPAIQHSLVSSALSCIPAHPADVQAEFFICNTFLNSLENILTASPKRRSDVPRGESLPRASINDNIPISLRDAR